jgi:hypothetical protein
MHHRQHCSYFHRSELSTEHTSTFSVQLCNYAIVQGMEVVCLEVGSAFEELYGADALATLQVCVCAS